MHSCTYIPMTNVSLVDSRALLSYFRLHCSQASCCQFLPALMTDPSGNVQRKNLRPKGLQSKHCWVQVPSSLLIYWEADRSAQITLKMFCSGQTDRHTHTHAHFIQLLLKPILTASCLIKFNAHTYILTSF